MGAEVSTFLKSIDANATVEDAVKESIGILQLACDHKLDAWEAQLKINFLHSSALAKTQVPGIRPLRIERGFEVQKDQEPAKRLDAAIDDFFGAGDATVTNNKIGDGFKNLVKAALNTILGNVQAGESEAEKTFIYFQHNAIVRIDLKMYRYRFNSESIKKHAKSAFAYIFCVSVVDDKALTDDEFSYLVSELAGNDFNKIGEYIRHLITVRRQVRKLQKLDQEELPTVSGHREGKSAGQGMVTGDLPEVQQLREEVISMADKTLDTLVSLAPLVVPPPRPKS